MVSSEKFVWFRVYVGQDLLCSPCSHRANLFNLFSCEKFVWFRVDVGKGILCSVAQLALSLMYLRDVILSLRLARVKVILLLIRLLVPSR